MSFLTGKPATSKSENVNNGLITKTYTPQMNNGVAANTLESDSLTGQGNQGAANAGYQNYLQNAGYAPAMKQLGQQVVGQGAASGILNSGTTARALQDRGSALNNQYYNNYMQNLNQVSQQGTQAGGLVANTGQQSTSTAATPGLLGSIGSAVGGGLSILSMASPFGAAGAAAGTIGSKIFSDRRLKTDIVKLGEEADGLGVYRFKYIGHDHENVGVMADEVEKLRPWAMGGKVAGYDTVDYGAL